MAFRAKRVPIVYPAKRCCAPGCGDKIKGSTGDVMIEVTDTETGDVRYLEDNGMCSEWFESGHPDIRDSARGKLEWV